MKVFLLTIYLTTSLLSTCQSQEKILGEIIDGKNVITVDQDSLLKIGNKILKGQKIFGTLSNVTIEKDIIEGTENTYYYLQFTSSDNTIKLVQLLNEVSGKFGTLQSTLESGTSVSCSGCRRGCDPKRYIDKDGQIEFYCSDCTFGETKDCKKSVSQGSLEL
jgi:hypothetical protein